MMVIWDKEIELFTLEERADIEYMVALQEVLWEF